MILGANVEERIYVSILRSTITYAAVVGGGGIVVSTGWKALTKKTGEHLRIGHNKVQNTTQANYVVHQSRIYNTHLRSLNILYASWAQR